MLVGSTKVLGLTDKHHENKKCFLRQQSLVSSAEEMYKLLLAQKAGMEVASSPINPCAICKARPCLAFKLPQAGTEITNSLGDLCAICVAEITPDPPPRPCKEHGEPNL